MSLVPASMIIMEWFADRPATPIALTARGMSVGGAMLAPLTALAIEGVGLGPAAVGAAVVQLLVMLPLCATILRRRPDPKASAAMRGRARGSTAAAAVIGRRRSAVIFGGICLVFGIMFAAQVANATHLLLMTAERSIPNAAFGFTVLAGTSIVSRLAGIPLLPRVGIGAFTVVVGAFQVAALVVMAFASDTAGLYLGCLLLGFNVGNAIVLLPLWILRVSGLAAYPGRYARSNLITSLGTGFAPLLMGLLHGASGGYRGSYLVFACASGLATMVAAALSVAVRTPAGSVVSEPLAKSPLDSEQQLR